MVPVDGDQSQDPNTKCPQRALCQTRERKQQSWRVVPSVHHLSAASFRIKGVQAVPHP